MVSVCMATYNGERFIKQQIDSILCQLDEDDELIISDDGSTDKTLSLIESFSDDRIKLIHHEKPLLKQNDVYKSFKYATSNFENALKHATGDYIFLTDQDDVWLENKVKSMKQYLSTFDCVVHNYKIIDTNGNVVKEKAFVRDPLHRNIFLNVIDNHFRGCCMAFSSEYLNKILPIPKMVIGHDYWIGILLAHYGTVFYDKDVRIQSRWYPGSVSAKKKRSIFYKVKYRLSMMVAVWLRLMTVFIRGENGK